MTDEKRITNKELQAQIEALQHRLGQITGHQVTATEPEKQMDYVAFGSDQHAGLLGIRKATDSDKPQVDGWAMEDIVSWGPTASAEFLEQMLRQKVNELTAKMPKTQSRDPLAPHFAPIMWRPGIPLSQITE